MIKKTLLIVLIGIMITSIFGFAEENIDQNQKAEELKELGLFKGSEKGFELERAPKRVESAVMLVRLLGKEREALESEYNHPFKDVPTWADKYIGYMYENSLTKGISDDKFGSDNLTDLKSYSTFVLRTLGYDDTNGDFSWSNAADKAQELKIVSEEQVSEINDKGFLRGNMVEVSYNSLKTNIKEQDKKLGNKLIEENVIKKENLEKTLLKETLDLKQDLSDVVELELEDGLVFYQNPSFPRSITTYIIKNQLPEKVQNFTKIVFTGITAKDFSVENIIREYIENKGIGHYQGDTYDKSGYGSVIQNTPDEKRLLILLDKEDNVLGYYLVKEGDYAESMKMTVNIRVKLSEPYDGSIRADDFKVIKKINGDVDPDFNWSGGSTSAEYNDDGLLTEVLIKNLLRENDNITYEVESLKDFKIRRVIIE